MTIRRQLDQRLKRWRALKTPRLEWLRTIREALGMPTAIAAKRAGVARTTWSRAEQAEKRGAISLSTMQRMAEALDCDVAYALVPRQSLQAAIQNRALGKATAEVRRAAHSMALEQRPTDRALLELAMARADELVRGPPKKLWAD